MAQKYSEQYKNLVTPLSDTSPDVQKLKQQAAQEFKDRMAGYDSRLNQLSALRQQDMGALRRNADVAQQKLDDRMFQQYLQTRERMGTRGLSNSGLMADAQIRLGMNKQDALADLFARTQSQIADVNKQYAPQQQTLLAEKQGIRQSEIEKMMRDQMMQQRLQQAQALTPLIQLTERSADSMASEKLQREQMARAAAAAKAQREAQVNAGAKSDRMGMAGYYAQTIAGSHKQMMDMYQAQINALDANSPTYTEDRKRLDALITQQYDAQQKALDVAEAYMMNNPKTITSTRSVYDSLGVQTGNTQKLTTPKTVEDFNKNYTSLTPTQNQMNFLQSVINDPYYVSDVRYGQKKDFVENYDKSLKENPKTGMTNLLAAMRMINAGIKPVISEDLLNEYKGIADASGYWAALGGASPSEVASARNFLDYYYKNQDDFVVK
ncbi:hypothetical protein UFOVP453_59 [uncultured Caudovirales phage]|uniref:Uncharacterized protein n=1 Tax=uncultured Caudovirales phage TaxID=2100421 RepID=A0A6J5MH74_9CAUD|nr:hypothetical protein UFOVP453_59 [uncultured Caudovirales phage]